MRRSLPLLAFTLTCATAALAQNVAVIKERHEHYEQMGKAAKPVFGMFEEEVDFDLAKVQEALNVIGAKAAILPKLFPDDSKDGEKVLAKPEIWDNKADFESRFKKLGEAAHAAQASIKDEDSFFDTWESVAEVCSGCHKKYKRKKEEKEE